MHSVTVSVVSHGHGALLPRLLKDLVACPEVGRIILTRNIPEPEDVSILGDCVSVFRNQHPKGFGANHNAAFQNSEYPFFAVINPDVYLEGNPFPELLACMQDERIAMCAPAVVNPAGALEDSAREFPSLTGLVRKACGQYDGRLHYELGAPPRPVPWVAGMFMLMRDVDYRSFGGFDEGYFLYYEDVDLCARLWMAKRPVMLCPRAHVVHDARRASRRNPRHMVWHVASMARYFRRHFWLPYQQLL